MNELAQDWYAELVDEIKNIWVEGVFNSRWALIETYHKVGELLVKAKLNNYSALSQVTRLTGISYITLDRACRFYIKFPDLALLPAGKNISIHKIIHELLPPSKENIIKIPLPQGEYDVIYADPPWQYDFSETQSRAIDSKYQSLSLDEIKNIKVPSAENAVLFLWATAPKLEQALEVMFFWGFTYKTHAVWDKEMIGMGYWFRGQHELLLVGTKGNFSPPADSLRVSSVYREKRTEHSKKPEYYYSLIEKMFPQGKYLELFARQSKNGWTAWGNESKQF